MWEKASIFTYVTAGTPASRIKLAIGQVEDGCSVATSGDSLEAIFRVGIVHLAYERVSGFSAHSTWSGVMPNCRFIDWLGREMQIKMWRVINDSIMLARVRGMGLMLDGNLVEGH